MEKFNEFLKNLWATSIKKAIIQLLLLLFYIGIGLGITLLISLFTHFQRNQIIGTTALITVLIILVSAVISTKNEEN